MGVGLFVDRLKRCIEKNSKLIRIKAKYKVPIKPWITIGILKCIRKRDRWLYKTKKTPGKVVLKKKLLIYNKCLQKLLRDEKMKYYHRVFSENKRNTKMI